MPYPPLPPEEERTFRAALPRFRQLAAKELASRPEGAYDDFCWRMMWGTDPKYDPEKATVILKEWIEWREREQLDCAHLEEFDVEIIGQMQMSYHGFDRDGRLLLASRPSTLDGLALFPEYYKYKATKEGTPEHAKALHAMKGPSYPVNRAMDHIMRYRSSVLERGRRACESAFGGTCTGIRELYDFTDFSKSTITRPLSSISLLWVYTTMFGFPGLIGSVHLCKLPPVMAAITHLTVNPNRSSLLPRLVAENTHVTMGNPAHSLRHLIDPIMIPQWLGGHCHGPAIAHTPCSHTHPLAPTRRDLPGGTSPSGPGLGSWASPAADPKCIRHLCVVSFVLSALPGSTGLRPKVVPTKFVDAITIGSETYDTLPIPVIRQHHVTARGAYILPTRPPQSWQQTAQAIAAAAAAVGYRCPPASPAGDRTDSPTSATANVLAAEARAMADSAARGLWPHRAFVPTTLPQGAAARIPPGPFDPPFPLASWMPGVVIVPATSAMLEVSWGASAVSMLSRLGNKGSTPMNTAPPSTAKLSLREREAEEAAMIASNPQADAFARMFFPRVRMGATEGRLMLQIMRAGGTEASAGAVAAAPIPRVIAALAALPTPVPLRGNSVAKNPAQVVECPCDDDGSTAAPGNNMLNASAAAGPSSAPRAPPGGPPVGSLAPPATAAAAPVGTARSVTGSPLVVEMGQAAAAPPATLGDALAGAPRAPSSRRSSSLPPPLLSVDLAETVPRFPDAQPRTAGALAVRTTSGESIGTASASFAVSVPSPQRGDGDPVDSPLIDPAHTHHHHHAPLLPAVRHPLAESVPHPASGAHTYYGLPMALPLGAMRAPLYPYGPGLPWVPMGYPMAPAPPRPSPQWGPMADIDTVPLPPTPAPAASRWWWPWPRRAPAAAAAAQPRPTAAAPPAHASYPMALPPAYVNPWVHLRPRSSRRSSRLPPPRGATGGTPPSRTRSWTRRIVYFVLVLAALHTAMVAVGTAPMMRYVAEGAAACGDGGGLGSLPDWPAPSWAPDMDRGSEPGAVDVLFAMQPRLECRDHSVTVTLPVDDCERWHGRNGSAPSPFDAALCTAAAETPTVVATMRLLLQAVVVAADAGWLRGSRRAPLDSAAGSSLTPQAGPPAAVHQTNPVCDQVATTSSARDMPVAVRERAAAADAAALAAARAAADEAAALAAARAVVDAAAALAATSRSAPSEQVAGADVPTFSYASAMRKAPTRQSIQPDGAAAAAAASFLRQVDRFTAPREESEAVAAGRAQKAELGGLAQHIAMLMPRAAGELPPWAIALQNEKMRSVAKASAVAADSSVGDAGCQGGAVCPTTTDDSGSDEQADGADGGAVAAAGPAAAVLRGHADAPPPDAVRTQRDIDDPPASAVPPPSRHPTAGIGASDASLVPAHSGTLKAQPTVEVTSTVEASSAGSDQPHRPPQWTADGRKDSPEAVGTTPSTATVLRDAFLLISSSLHKALTWAIGGAVRLASRGAGLLWGTLVAPAWAWVTAQPEVSDIEAGADSLSAIVAMAAPSVGPQGLSDDHTPLLPTPDHQIPHIEIQPPHHPAPPSAASLEIETAAVTHVASASSRALVALDVPVGTAKTIYVAVADDGILQPDTPTGTGGSLVHSVQALTMWAVGSLTGFAMSLSVVALQWLCWGGYALLVPAATSASGLVLTVTAGLLVALAITGRAPRADCGHDSVDEEGAGCAAGPRCTHGLLPHGVCACHPEPLHGALAQALIAITSMGVASNAMAHGVAAVATAQHFSTSNGSSGTATATVASGHADAPSIVSGPMRRSVSGRSLSGLNIPWGRETTLRSPSVPMSGRAGSIPASDAVSASGVRGAATASSSGAASNKGTGQLVGGGAAYDHNLSDYHGGRNENSRRGLRQRMRELVQRK